MTEDRIDEVVALLKRQGAKFAYLYGSRAAGTARASSDYEVAALFEDPNVDEFAVTGALPAGFDLLVLDRAPLELAGRVATEGSLLFELDAARRVVWESTTRRIYFDELPRIEQMVRVFKTGAKSRGRR